MKKAMVVAAVAGIGAMAPAMASADVWSTDGVNPYVGSGIVTGELRLTMPSGASTWCHTETVVTLNNSGPGGTAAGTIDSFDLSDCETNVPGCTVTAASHTLPWEISTVGKSVTITGVHFVNSYEGGLGCQLNGYDLAATGSVTGTASDNVLSFLNATGLTTDLGDPVVNGDVEVTDTSGNPIELI